MAPRLLGAVAVALVFAAIWLGPDVAGAALLLLAIALTVAALGLQEMRVRDAAAALEQTNRRMARLATTDELTQLPNRTAFERSVEAEIARARRTTGRFALVWLRLRGLAALEHGGADRVLRDFAACLPRHTRAVDARARLGGDAFAVVLVGADPAAARTILSRVRTGCADLDFGIAYYPTDGDVSPAQLIRLAEERVAG